MHAPLTTSLARSLAPALLVGATVAAGLAAAPAQAEGVRLQDPADATASPYDISAVTVRHGAERTTVIVQFADLQPQGSSGMSVFIDTDPALRGPEFRLGAGLFDGTDYTLGPVRNWRDRLEILSCTDKLRLDYTRERATYRVGNDCLGDPDELRVGVKVTDTSDGSHPVTDWVPARRGFTDWLVAG